MKDIRALFSRAKFGTDADRAIYTEAVQSIANTDPVGYISELEYIIGSGVGLRTLGTFVTENVTLPLAAIRAINETATTLLEKAEGKANPCVAEYRGIVERTGIELDRNQVRLAMFEAYESELPSGYLKFLFEGSHTVVEALNQFGPGALPDCLHGCFVGTIETVVEAANEHLTFSNPLTRQWLVESTRDLVDEGKLSPELFQKVSIGSIEGLIKESADARQLAYRESVLMGEDPVSLYTEADIDMIAAYAAFQENMLVGLRTSDAIFETSNKVNDAYLELDGLVDESCADIAAMLPTGQRPRIIREGNDRVTGRIPDFIAKHHDIGYGETDATKPKSDRYEKAPAAKIPTTPAKPDDPTTNGDMISDDELRKLGDVQDDDPVKKPGAAGTNYYYNYYNSFNRSKTDDHSTHNTSTDNSSSTKDDHSVGKRIKSNDNVSEPSVHTENTINPWSLNLGGYIVEATVTEPEVAATPGAQAAPTNEAGPAFSPEENVIRPGTKRGFRLFPKKATKKEETKPADDKANDPIVLEHDYGFRITSGTMAEDRIAEKLVTFLRQEYHAREKAAIELVKTLAGDEHKILGNVVMEPGLETMWTDLYHLDEMLLSETGNVVFSADNGETILFEHMIGRYEFDAAKVTDEKFDEFLKSYGLNPNSEWVKEMRSMPIAEWGRMEWGQAAAMIFETLSLPALQKLNLPKATKVTYVTDDTLWDGLIGAKLVFTDLDETITEFNKELGEGGSVAIERDPIATAESVAVAYERVLLDETFPLYTEKTKPSNAEPAPEPETEDPNDDPERPKSDHPVKDTIQDIDRVLTRKGAEAKKKVNDVINVGKVIAKPAKRTAGWINNLINRYKDADETKIKERMADPHERSVLFKGIRTAITTGALFKAGLLLNPVFLFLAITRGVSKHRNHERLRTDVIGQLKTEGEILDEKIKDADNAGDKQAKYKLMRFKSEIQKKLIRVGGGKELQRIV